MIELKPNVTGTGDVPVIGGATPAGGAEKPALVPANGPSAHAARAANSKLSELDSRVLEQIRAGEMPSHKAVDELVSLVDAGKLSIEDALLTVDASSLAELLLPSFAGREGASPIATGPGVSPGCASGTVVFDVHEAAERVARGEKVILAITNIPLADVPVLKSLAGGMGGIICAEGGYSAHTAVVARDFGIPAVNNPDVFKIDAANRTVDLGGVALEAGQQVSLDGRTGEIFNGLQSVVIRAESPSFKRLIQWAQANKGIDVYANADLPASATRALELGASGVGLVRTEHMFFGERRTPLQAATLVGTHMDKLAAWQQQDFTELFRAAAGRPVAIRLIDPPTHEMAPAMPQGLRNPISVAQMAERMGVSKEHVEEAFRTVFGDWEPTHLDRLFFDPQEDSPEMVALAKELDVGVDAVRSMVKGEAETNPMLGKRGVRLGLIKPEIYDMQIRAILRAAAEVRREGIDMVPQITVPMISNGRELENIKRRIEAIRTEVETEVCDNVPYKLGAMVETPSAVLRADELYNLADYFSIGSNDLTQFTLALSRDDAAPIVDKYKEEHLWDDDPARELDRAVVQQVAITASFGQLAKDEGREFTVGLCGEQGGSPKSIAACAQAGVDYVSVSLYKVPSAIVASAQAKIQNERQSDAELQGAAWFRALRGLTNSPRIR